MYGLRALGKWLGRLCEHVGDRAFGNLLAETAMIGGMDRQRLRDPMIRSNDQGRGGLINRPATREGWKLDFTRERRSDKSSPFRSAALGLQLVANPITNSRQKASIRIAAALFTT
jgi:hypothetical protein